MCACAPKWPAVLHAAGPQALRRRQGDSMVERLLQVYTELKRGRQASTLLYPTQAQGMINSIHAMA